jgi:hypothetical protein
MAGHPCNPEAYADGGRSPSPHCVTLRLKSPLAAQDVTHGSDPIQRSGQSIGAWATRDLNALLAT